MRTSLSSPPSTVAGRDLQASGSSDGTVRICDQATGAPLITIPTHHEVLAVYEVAPLLAVGLDAGILVIKLSLDA